ncbi:GNAT family N-acetyltransferase [Micropruina sonneratiae]|uniref:GNAT family N-acetyltransferase n=1 Tax=Micropruina sonneratiae TaxID=2986940 RepID=UPI002225D69F|nr:GNAT family N-acetyltransferase [Micropruina sp. KQZ13P-5]MCW3157247.1 GNAT family N-acetyltransferase [Micropruina sp. KQZ13P-5]
MKRARALGTRDAGPVRELLAADPVANLFVASRVDAGVLWSGSPATLYGWPGNAPRHLLHAGSNLVPVLGPCDDDERNAAIDAFADALGPHRWCQSIVGRSEAALALHAVLAGRGRSYAAQREIRPRQPLMVAREVLPQATEAPVRRITMAEFDSYLAAAVAMYTEEVGVDPTIGGGRSGYRAHCQGLVESGRAWGVVEDGTVVFKADVGLSCGGIAQVQGVWLAPHLRGRGLAAPAMAAATRGILRQHDVVSLYVNDYNVRAVRTYLRTGFAHAGEFATVLY